VVTGGNEYGRGDEGGRDVGGGTGEVIVGMAIVLEH
jgi:hypothetical protein